MSELPPPWDVVVLLIAVGVVGYIAEKVFVWFMMRQWRRP